MIDEPLLQCPSGNCNNVYFYYADGLGLIRQLTNTSGSITNQYRYSAWGELNYPFINNEDINNSYTYTSRELSENNLYYYRSRYLFFNHGRFISQDSFKNSGYYFAYVSNHPILYKDPSGMFEVKTVKIAPKKLGLNGLKILLSNK